MATPESESPNEQVYQSTGKAPWFKRILFTQVKIPGWLAVLLSVIWSVFTSVPDWKGRVDFWLDAAKASGGYTGEAASVIGSSYFSIALAVTGVLWLALVGEPKRGVLRDPRWVYLGWAVVLIVSMGLVATIINGYIEVRAQEISEGRDNEVINGLLDKLSDANLRIIQIEKANERQKTARHLWRLTEDEKRTVVSLLSLAPKGRLLYRQPSLIRRALVRLPRI